MQVHSILYPSYVDGPGPRVVLFLQGCPIRCPGCQNRHLWDPKGGKEIPVEEVARRLLTTGLPVTISGGEPFAQARELAELLHILKEAGVHVIVYSGFRFEVLLSIAGAVPGIMTTLHLADVLVDGPFIASLKEGAGPYRGSANQRAIDLPATFAAGEVVEVDWGELAVSILPDGSVVSQAEATPVLKSLGPSQRTRRCGETCAASTPLKAGGRTYAFALAPGAEANAFIRRPAKG